MEPDQIVTFIFATMGVALSCVKFLQWVVVPLRNLAKMTAWKTDDELVEVLASIAAKLMAFLLVLGKALAPIALQNPKTVFTPSPKPPEEDQ